MATTKTRKPRTNTRVKATPKAAPKAAPQPPQLPTPSVSIGIPTRRNLKILWLALEGLLRQVTDVVFEVIVLESPSDQEATEVVNKYREKFEAKGIALRYKMAPVSHALPMKWKFLAEMADGKYFIMLGSDDYSPSTLVQKTFDAFIGGADWVDSPAAYFFDFRTGAVGLWKKPYPRSGCQCACLTADLAAIPDDDRPRGVDQYVMDSIAPKQQVHIDHIDGVHTDGYNGITTHRAAMYNSKAIRKPFHSTDRRLDELVPEDVLVSMKKMMA